MTLKVFLSGKMFCSTLGWHWQEPDLPDTLHWSHRNLFGPYWISWTEVHPIKLNQLYKLLSPRLLCTSPYFTAASKQCPRLRGGDYYFNYYLIILRTSMPGTKFISPRGFSLIKIPQLPKHVLSIFGGNQNVVHDWNSDAIEHSMTSPPMYPQPCYFLSPWQLFGPEPCPDNDDFPTTQPRPLTNARFCLRAML